MKQAELEAHLYLLNTANGPPCFRPLIEQKGSAERAWRAIRPKVPAQRLAKAEEFVHTGLRTIEQLGVEVLALSDPRYPPRLQHLNEWAPAVLFARGRLDLTERVILGVVGSRRCTEYGMETTRELTLPAARAGVVIVSGLALGIDHAAHVAALDGGGDTIAVLGCGIDVCYPPRHRQLFEHLASAGLLLSEFAPGAQPLAYHFPHRNRIIALLAHYVLVVEATLESGSLITARKAMDHIHVMAAPGPIGRPTSAGCNLLIRQGAELVTSGADVLLAMSLTAQQDMPAAQPVAVDEESRTVWAVLSSEGLHIDQVAARAKLPVATVAQSLLQLELSGHVRQLPGSRFALPQTA